MLVMLTSCECYFGVPCYASHVFEWLFGQGVCTSVAQHVDCLGARRSDFQDDIGAMFDDFLILLGRFSFLRPGTIVHGLVRLVISWFEIRIAICQLAAPLDTRSWPSFASPMFGPRMGTARDR